MSYFVLKIVTSTSLKTNKQTHKQKVMQLNAKEKNKNLQENKQHTITKSWLSRNTDLHTLYTLYLKAKRKNK